MGTKVAEPTTLEELVWTVSDPLNKSVRKLDRKVIYSTSNGIRPTGKEAFNIWNGFQVIDMDIKDAELADKLKRVIFTGLHKCNWFLGVVLSSSGRGLHVYTKISVPDDLTEENRKILFLTNFRHKYSFVYIAAMNAMEDLGFTKEQLQQWMDLAMFKPQQGAFIGYDDHPLFSTRFFEDGIYISFDNVEDLGHPELDWVTYPDLKGLFSRWEWFENKEYDESPEVKVLQNDDSGAADSTNKIHYKHNERWRLANTLVALYGLEKGNKYLRQITSNAVSSRELQADCLTANRHKKSVDIWAVNRLNSMHGFNIKLDIQDREIDESELLGAMETIENPNLISKSKYYKRFDINKNQYLGHIINEIMSYAGRLTLIEAGPGLGKTEMVKQLVRRGKKVMMVMPFTSTIKSKVESDPDWYYSYGSRKPKLDVSRGLALTLDKFSRLNLMDIKTNGFDYIFIDESHLLFMSEYRSIMSHVIDMIKNTEVPIVLMSGTPTGELVFFQDIVHIQVVKEETRKKELEVNLVDNTSNLMYHMCRAMAHDIAKGRRILFPSNEGVRFSYKVKAGIEYFLRLENADFTELNLKYYKKSQIGEQFMDDVNFEKTIKDIQVLMCTSYLSVGVDILDKYDFRIYFGDLCTAAECDQWSNRLRSNDLYIKMFIAKADADGNPREIDRFTPMNFKLDPEEIKDMHSILRICNAALERNPTYSKYNSLVSSIVQNNNYIVYDPIECKYHVDETAYKTIMFERKYREYTQQLPVFMKGMQCYGYTVSAQDLGQFAVEGNEVFKDLKNMVQMASDEHIQLSTVLVEELLDLITPERLTIYQDVLQGKYDLRKSPEWKEDPVKGVMYVKSIEVFEKVVPIFLSLTKMFDVTDVPAIFDYCKRDNGTYNFAAISRFRALVNIVSADENKRLDLPIKEFMEKSLSFAEENETCHKNDLKKFIYDFSNEYATGESTIEILIARSELTMKRLVDTFTKIFRCLINVSRPGKDGEVSLKPVEILWQTREQKYKNIGENQYIISDFLDIIVESNRRE